eukprot:353105-Chlamydomonas_euryale.AAC.3
MRGRAASHWGGTGRRPLSRQRAATNGAGLPAGARCGLAMGDAEQAERLAGRGGAPEIDAAIGITARCMTVQDA